MQIGAIGYPTFVYNTNYVSSRSLGKVRAIPNDALAGKVGYAGSSKNENPLRVGTSKDFVGILASQMAMSRQNAARIMKEPAEEAGDRDMQAVQDAMDMPAEI